AGVSHAHTDPTNTTRRRARTRALRRRQHTRAYLRVAMKIDRSSEQKGKENGRAPAGPMDTAMLFRAYAEFVAAFLRRLGVAEADIDDAVQEVFLVAHRKGGYVPGPGLPRTWVAGIAVLVAQASTRKRLRRRETSDADAPSESRRFHVDPHSAL